MVNKKRINEFTQAMFCHLPIQRNIESDILARPCNHFKSSGLQEVLDRLQMTIPNIELQI